MLAPQGWAVDAEAALADLRALASDEMAGREAGSEEGERARAWIIGQLHAAGVAPLGAGYERPFFWVQLDGQKRHGVNLLAWIPGGDRDAPCLLLSAHYDHLGTTGPSHHRGGVYNGADDNASGVAALLAAARHFVAHPPRASLLLAFFDGEEAELRGSRHFTMHPPIPLDRVRANVNVDMIGRSSDGALWAAGSRHFPRVRAALEDAVRDVPLPVRFGHDRLGWVPFLQHDWTEAGDHFAFHEAGIPWVYLGTTNDPETHDASDTMASIDEAFFVRATETVIRIVGHLGDHLATGAAG